MILVKSENLYNGQWALIPNRYNERFKDLAKQIPGMTWDRKIRAWTGYKDATQLLIKNLTTEKVAKVVGDLPTTTTVQPLTVQDPKCFALRPYQRDGISFLINQSIEGALLADATGIGKTIQSVLAIQSIGTPAIIVCPAVVKHVWERELLKVDLNCIILNGIKPKESFVLSQNDIVIINYDIVYAWFDKLKGAKIIVFDEGHALINPKSRRSLVCKELAHSAKHRIILSATPISSRAKELWNIVDTISPGRFGSFFSYALRYCNAIKETIKVKNGEEKLVWNFDGISHIDELHERIQQFMLKRTKADVKLQLPPKTRQIIEIDIPKNQIESDHNWDLHSSSAVRIALNLAAKSKIVHAVNLAVDHHNEGNTVVLFTYERAVARDIKKLLTEKGKEVYIATGEDSAKKRDETLEKARKDTPCILVVTSHSMGEGVDMSFANVGIVVELDYLPRILIQSEGRLDRQGQKNNILIQYLIGIGSIDELIRNAVLSKLEIIDQTIGSSDDTIKKDLAGYSNENDALNELRESLLKMGEEYV